MLSEMMNSNCEQNTAEHTDGKTEAGNKETFILGDCKPTLIESGPKVGIFFIITAMLER